MLIRSMPVTYANLTPMDPIPKGRDPSRWTNGPFQGVASGISCRQFGSSQTRSPASQAIRTPLFTSALHFFLCLCLCLCLVVSFSLSYLAFTCQVFHLFLETALRSLVDCIFYFPVVDYFLKYPSYLESVAPYRKYVILGRGSKRP